MEDEYGTHVWDDIDYSYDLSQSEGEWTKCMVWDFTLGKEQNFNIPETLMQHPIPTFAADRQECRSEIYQPKFLIMGTFELIIASVMAILVVVSNISSVGRIWQR